MKRILTILLIIFVATVTGCYYDNEEKLYPKTYDPCNDNIVTFSLTVTSISQSCQGCHSNPNAKSSGNGIKLQNYADVQSYVKNGRLMGAVNHSSGYVAMPKGGGKLTACEINQLQKWIDNGILNN
jgi:hypothetical protein